VIENDLESVTLKLVALDKDGNVVASNSASEGGFAFYKVIAVLDDGVSEAVDGDGNPLSGFVDIVYTDGTAKGGTAVTGVEGEIDFKNDVNTNVELNKVFSVELINDAESDDNETFEVNIVNDSYTLSEAQKFENVVTDTTKITTTITETVIPTVTFIRISDSVSVVEADGVTLTHTLDLVALDGRPINLANGETITINFAYSGFR